jgi:prevent-host-death family protein
MKVSVAELKARLSEHVRYVRGGREVIITDRGVPVARLAPLDPAERQKTRRGRLVRDGVLEAGRGRLRAAFATAPEGAPVGADVLAMLLRDRRDADR